MFSETFKTIMGLLGGLAVFIFGMNMMSECLQKVAGEKMRSILSLLTRNRILGVIAGALTTAVLQSSSATTVMAIGFVSAGLMSLPQAISIILGANIGTTITAQIIAFKITDYIYVFIFVGFIISFIAKSARIKSIGQTIFAFGLLFLGIETMGSVMKPLASSAFFTDMISKVSGLPVLGVLAGTFMTLVVQSSSATIAVLQNFASQPAADGVTSIIGLTGAIPILLGDNIGTTITALLACIGQSKDAKRTAAAHCVFNVSGAFIFIWIVTPFAKFIQLISPSGNETEVISRQIANAHTMFNIVMTLIWIPLLALLVAIVRRIIPDGGKMSQNPFEAKFLDTKLVGQPAAALRLIGKETLNFSSLAENLLNDLLKAVKTGDKKYIDRVTSNSAAAQKLHDTIMDYLSEFFSAGVLTEEQATHTAGIMYLLNDIDRINSICSDIAVFLRERAESKYKYSEEAMLGIEKAITMIRDMYFSAFNTDGSSGSLLEKKEAIIELYITMRKAHMSRVADGKCAPELTAPFNRLLNNIDRMGNCCINITEALSGAVDLSYFETAY